jgi:hypothetical protein
MEMLHYRVQGISLPRWYNEDAQVRAKLRHLFETEATLQSKVGKRAKKRKAFKYKIILNSLNSFPRHLLIGYWPCFVAFWKVF